MPIGAATERDVRAIEDTDCGDRRKRRALLAQPGELPGRNLRARRRPGPDLLNVDETLGVWHRQLPEHQAIDHAEDCSVGADAYSQRQNGDGRKAAALSHRSQRVPAVLNQMLEQLNGRRGAALHDAAPQRTGTGRCSFEYSARASSRIGRSRSASFHNARNSSYAAVALDRSPAIANALPS